MSYRDLQEPQNRQSRFQQACTYANFLWINGLPARAVLALCRAIYLPPGDVPYGRVQPYRAHVWFLKNHRCHGFLGNPRISFARQATRIPSVQDLKIHRAWAMWHLSIAAIPELPPDPQVTESPPPVETLAHYLNANGLQGEGDTFLKACEEA